LTACGLALFAASLQSTVLAIAGIAIAGIGFGALLGAPTRYIITNEVPATTRATGVGLLSVFLIIGQIVGGSLAGGVVGARIDDVAGYRLAYEMFAAVAIVTALATLLLASRENERKIPL
jgi:MFS family permease